MRETCFSHDGALNAGAKITIAMDGHRDGSRGIGVRVNMVRSTDVMQDPAS